MEDNKKERVGCPECSGTLWVIANYLYISFHEGKLPLSEENIGLILYVATMSRQLWGKGNSLNRIRQKYLLNLPSELRRSDPSDPRFCRVAPIAVGEWFMKIFKDNSYEVNGLKMLVGPTRRKISHDRSYRKEAMYGEENDNVPAVFRTDLPSW